MWSILLLVFDVRAWMVPKVLFANRKNKCAITIPVFIMVNNFGYWYVPIKKKYTFYIFLLSLGTCEPLVNGSFQCHCQSGWHGSRCQTRENLCQNVTCLNGAVCRTIDDTFQCECLNGDYHGQYCEIVSSTMQQREQTSKSVAYIAIIALCLLFLIIVVMDLLKYVFEVQYSVVDPKKEQRCQRKTYVGTNFIYVNRAWWSSSWFSKINSILYTDSLLKLLWPTYFSEVTNKQN